MGVATALAIGSLAVSAAGTGMSFAQAAKQRRLQEEAEKKADKMMKEARAKLDVNYMEALGIAKEPYELEREQMRAAGAQATAAAVEGEQRGVGATVGRVMAAEQQGQAGIRAEMAKDVYELEKAVATEEGRLRDEKVKLDLAEVEGAQAAAAQAENLRSQAIQQGIQGAASTVQQGLQFLPLYQQNIGAQKAAVAQMSDETLKGFGITNTTQQQIGDMTNRQFRQFKSGLNATQFGSLFNSDAYQGFYQDPYSQWYKMMGWDNPAEKKETTPTTNP